MVLVNWGFLLTYFQTSVGLLFWEYQIGSLMQVIGHIYSNEQHGQHREDDDLFEYSTYNGNYSFER